MDEVRVYNEVLDAAGIIAAAQAGQIPEPSAAIPPQSLLRRSPDPAAPLTTTVSGSHPMQGRCFRSAMPEAAVHRVLGVIGDPPDPLWQP